MIASMNPSPELNNDSWALVFDRLGFRDQLAARSVCWGFYQLITPKFLDISEGGNAQALVVKKGGFWNALKVKWIPSGSYYLLAETMQRFQEDGHITKAVENDHQDALDLMIRLGIGVDEANKNGETAMRLACDCLNEVAVNKLFAAGAKLNCYTAITSPLMGPLMQNHLGLVRLLVEKGIPKEDIQAQVTAFRAAYPSAEQEAFQELLTYLDGVLASS